MQKGDRVMLLALASGIEIGIALFTIGNQVDRYGRERSHKEAEPSRQQVSMTKRE